MEQNQTFFHRIYILKPDAIFFLSKTLKYFNGFQKKIYQFYD